MESRSKSGAIVADSTWKVCGGKARAEIYTRAGIRFAKKSDALENLFYAATSVLFLVVFRVF